MAKTRKRASTSPRSKKVVVNKKDIEGALVRMEHCLFMVRKALKAYDGKTDTAIFYPPSRVVGPPIVCLDCKPGGGPNR